MKKLAEILKDLEQGKISADHAESQVLRLFNDILAEHYKYWNYAPIESS